MCFSDIKLERFHDAVEDCNKVLTMEPSNIKGALSLRSSRAVTLTFSPRLLHKIATHIFFMSLLYSIVWDRHRGNTYLTSLPLVSVRHHGHVNSVKDKMKFHHECELCFPSAEFMLRQMHRTNLSETIEAKYWVSWKVKTWYENALNSSFCAVTADPNSRWPQRGKTYFRRGVFETSSAYGLAEFCRVGEGGRRGVGTLWVATPALQTLTLVMPFGMDIYMA